MEAQRQGRQPPARVDVAKKDRPITNGRKNLTLMIARYALEYHLSRIETEPWQLDALFLYNPHPSGGIYPCLPIVLVGEVVNISSSDEPSAPRVVEFCIETYTKARELVALLGEPSRTGGGELMHFGPSLWLEWRLRLRLQTQEPGDAVASREMSLHVSLQGDGSRGADRWERGKASECTWEYLHLQ
ncbi:hypothetical protein K437DRAFT_266093 [Tilletiaria anomala UBC 951]|uniref:Uncharacterized protein n=1 Tax=Tilletiaria anomala (strain ATCC 24038 / CBS 436.72 / UBC 951) TaxID=1037660 RepID=A0A066WH57_TILAU|nr:uncharacterized protein K437DRAFT_266093 [Tilletiaria anomala UBC 951]KDN53166.1 hypothetical protein K437DRAFT_266093 [Tilletiaria anomala UBC 951]